MHIHNNPALFYGTPLYDLSEALSGFQFFQDDKKNEKMAEQFEATGTALFLYNPKTGTKKELTDFAFMNAKSDSKKFKAGLEKEINAFK